MCSSTFTVKRSDLPASYEPLGWGTNRWAKQYNRRSLVETYNATQQFHQREDEHTFRVMAPNWKLMHMLRRIGGLLLEIHRLMLRCSVSPKRTLKPKAVRAALTRIENAPPLTPQQPDPPPEDPLPPKVVTKHTAGLRRLRRHHRKQASQ